MSAVNLSLDFSSSGYSNENSPNSFSTGFPALDVMLPEGGWPVGAVTEIFCSPDIYDIANMLAWPTLARLNQASRWLALVAPPCAPSAAQLRAEGIDLAHVLMIHPHTTTNGLWAVEQALRAGTCAAVVSWVNFADYHATQDLRGAALAGNSCGLLFRPECALSQPSAARLRLQLTLDRNNKRLYVEMLPHRTDKGSSGVFIEIPLLRNART